jgi:branched-chain amino acid transport system substrate-binding protein
VFLGGIVSNNGGQLIKDKVSVLGDNSKVILLAPDGFNDSATAKDAGSAAEGMYVTIGGQDPNKLSNAPGKAFIAAFKKAYHVKQLEAYTGYGAQAFLVLANAIQKNGSGARGNIAKYLYNQNFPNGIIGSFRIDSTGDPSLGGVTVDQITNGTITPLVVVLPPASLAVKALG